MKTNQCFRRRSAADFGGHRRWPTAGQVDPDRELAVLSRPPLRWLRLRSPSLLTAPKAGTPSQRPGYAMRSHHGLRRASIVAGIVVALLVGAQPAAAAPTDTVFPVPVVGASVIATGLPFVGAMYVTASTELAMPGITDSSGTATAASSFIGRIFPPVRPESHTSDIRASRPRQGPASWSPPSQDRPGRRTTRQ